MDNEICEARVGSSRHAAWVLHVIRATPDELVPFLVPRVGQMGQPDINVDSRGCPRRRRVRRERPIYGPRCVAQGNGGEARSQERAEARQPVPGLRVRLERPSGEEVDSEHQTRPQEGLYDVHE
jgi:hypothetical protein